ncbi:unnamed protein product [Polarella glacialis]|uniref:Uncharacterized protein n=1 Tax=Polarella glacialis TaxID=89957 RepID=A0A813JK28_POLGL|nr:unnamed protein product [Polarella glacialis]
MGQASASWCTEGVADNVDDLVWPTSSSALRPQRYSASGSHSSDVPDMHRLLAGCPRDLVELLKETGQVGALRCRPWLSSGGLRSLQRSLQCCQLNVTARRYKEAETRDEYTYSVPTVVPWAELDLDHVVSAGILNQRPCQHLALATQLPKLKFYGAWGG